MKSERFKKIEAENKKFEQETPYNFCDRWCARCIHEKQMRCKLYQDELEQKLTCIAHGKDENDPEITEKVMERQFEDMEKQLQSFLEEHNIDIDFDQDNVFANEEINNHRKPLKDDPLLATADKYFHIAHEFLEGNFYHKNTVAPKLINDFETIAWYHSLLVVKLHRALSGFDESDDDDDIVFHDSVAQFAICQKAIKESIKALRNIQPDYPGQKTSIVQLLALLNNISHRIEKLEESI